MNESNAILAAFGAKLAPGKPPPTCAKLANWLPRCCCWDALADACTEISPDGAGLLTGLEQGSEASVDGFITAAMAAHMAARESAPSRRWANPIQTLLRDYYSDSLRDATVTAARGYTRRHRSVSDLRATDWGAALVDAAIIDGEPLATELPSVSAAFGEPKRRRVYRRGEQAKLKLPGYADAPVDLRLAALGQIPHGLGRTLPGDVLTLMNVAHASDRPVMLTEWEGAKLLARNRDGGYRYPGSGDRERFQRAARELAGTALCDPRGSERWVSLALVDPVGDGRIMLAAPGWVRGKAKGQWALTAEGGKSAMARVRANSPETIVPGRIVTGIENYLYGAMQGHKHPYVQPANGKGGPGPVQLLGWRTVMLLAGFNWDPDDEAADHRARVKYDRAVRRLIDPKLGGYLLPRNPDGTPNLRGEAEAGDAIEIIRITKGGRGRPKGMQVRASARFVAAAKAARRRGGQGFRTVELSNYLGL